MSLTRLPLGGRSLASLQLYNKLSKKINTEKYLPYKKEGRVEQPNPQVSVGILLEKNRIFL